MKKVTIKEVCKCLRNTTKKQVFGKYYSRSKDAYCAVGVCLSELLGWNPEKSYDYDELVSRYIGDDLKSKLIHLNDNKRFSFSKIASVIEEV